MEKLLRILREINDEIDFENENALVDDGLLDSMDLLRIIPALDEAYGIRIDPGSIGPDNFNSARAMLALVTACGGRTEN